LAESLGSGLELCIIMQNSSPDPGPINFLLYAAMIAGLRIIQLCYITDELPVLNLEHETMHIKASQFVLSPSDLTLFMDSPFAFNINQAANLNPSLRALQDEALQVSVISQGEHAAKETLWINRVRLDWSYSLLVRTDRSIESDPIGPHTAIKIF
jgi:hypothetical protein